MRLKNKKNKPLFLNDFKRKELVSKAQISFLIMVLGDFAKNLSLSFGTKLRNRMTLHLQFAALEEMSYLDCIKAMSSEHRAVAFFSHDFPFIFEFPQKLSMEIDKIIRNKQGLKSFFSFRDPINHILKIEFEQALQRFYDFPGHKVLKLKKEIILENRYSANLSHIHEQFYCASFAIQINDNDNSSFNVYFPVQFAANLKALKQYRHLFLQKPIQETSPEEKAMISLGNCFISKEEIANLQTGDVFLLDSYWGNPAQLILDGKVIAKAEICVYNEHYAIRIVEQQDELPIPSELLNPEDEPKLQDIFDDLLKEIDWRKKQEQTNNQEQEKLEE